MGGMIGWAVAVAMMLGSIADEPEAITWGEMVAPGAGVWVRLLELDGKRWMSVRTVFDRERPTRLVLAMSDDRCRTWRDVGDVVQEGRNLDNGLLFQAGAGGPVLLACRSVAVDRSSGRLLVFRGDEEGKEWPLHGTIDASEVEPGKIFGLGLWEPWLYALPDGRIAAAYATEKHASETPAFSQICALRVSEDGGATWDAERVMVAQEGGGKLRPGMPVVNRLKDGRYLAVYEVVGIGDAQVFQKWSDDGETWPEGLGTRVEGHRAGPYVLALGDGRLLLTSCSNRVSWSGDGGKTWTMIEERAWVPQRQPLRTWLTWPAIFEVGGGEVAVTTSAMGERPYEIRFGTVGPVGR